MAARRPAHRWRQALAIRVAWPVSPETAQRLLAGDAAAIDDDPGLARLLAVLRADNPLGDFDLYQCVAELTPGWEIFRPGPQARPAMGAAGTDATSPGVMVTIHVPAEADVAALDAAIDALMAAHPWEVPVLEVSEVRLAVRGEGTGPG